MHKSLHSKNCNWFPTPDLTFQPFWADALNSYFYWLGENTGGNILWQAIVGMGFIETERANLVAWLFFDAGSVRQRIVDATPVEMTGDMP